MNAALDVAPLRLSDSRYLLIVLLPALAVWGLLTAPQNSALRTLCVWALIAGVDAFWPGAQRSPQLPPHAQPHPALQWLLRLYVPLQWALICIGAWAAAQGSWALVLGLGLTVGFVTGAQGITLAHELGHSRSALDRAMGWLLMASVGYAHFMVEHYRGHHPRAATLEDPASARRGESLWRFLPRTLFGCWRSAWLLEAQRLERFGNGWQRSALAWSMGITALVVMTLVALSAFKVLAFLAVQAAFGIWLLETVNYIEHYGLTRATQGDQREPFSLFHAWNADHVATNSLLANLQRHSDHHMHAWKPWPTLKALPGPQLPTGYAGCLALAALPPVWFALMHPRLEEVQARVRALSLPPHDDRAVATN